MLCSTGRPGSGNHITLGSVVGLMYTMIYMYNWCVDISLRWSLIHIKFDRCHMRQCNDVRPNSNWSSPSLCSDYQQIFFIFIMVFCTKMRCWQYQPSFLSWSLLCVWRAVICLERCYLFAPILFLFGPINILLFGWFLYVLVIFIFVLVHFKTSNHICAQMREISMQARLVLLLHPMKYLQKARFNRKWVFAPTNIKIV